MSRNGPSCIFALLVAVSACQADSEPPPLPADTIYTNGDIVAGADFSSRVEAVAVREGRVVALGNGEQVNRFAGEGTRTVDLGGYMMLPGLNDNHVHANAGRGSLMEWKGGWISTVPAWVREATTIDELKDALQREAGRRPAGEWIVGALSREVWPNQSLPTRADLDAGTADHPVLLTRGPHTTVVNSAALELAGIDRNTTFSGGGEIGHDESGEPDGRLFDAARRLMGAVVPAPVSSGMTDQEAVESLRSLMLQFAAMGTTSVNVAGVRPAELRHFQMLYDQYGDSLPRAILQIRLRPGYDAYDDLELSVSDAIAELEGLGMTTGYGDDRLSYGAVKMSIDGGLSAPAYWSLEPYESKPDFTGVIRIPAEAFYPVARRAHELGWQLGIHTMGDGAVVMVVDQLERILSEMPREDHRHYLHHVAVKPPEETIRKMAALGIGVASQPAFTVGLGAFAVESLAGDREATMNPTKSLLDAGVWMSWGSDGAPYGPRVTLWTGVTRKGWDDRVYGAGEAVSREEALRLHTQGPAYQTFDEQERGSIEVGKFADFTVVGENYFTIDADRIRYLPIMRTIVGGRDIFVNEEFGR